MAALTRFYPNVRMVNNIGEFRDKMRKSQEKALGFSFLFDFDTDADFLYEFVKLLRREGFFY